MTMPETIFDHPDFIVISKPAGMLSIPDRVQSAPSLKDLLLAQYGSIFTVHRLDRETSGLIVFAKNEAAHKHLSQQFEERTTRKIYVGLVPGKPSPAEGVIDVPIAEHHASKGMMVASAKGKPSVTEYRLLEPFRAWSWMEFHILTGRTHQIRVHMKHLGHPIACDEIYGDGQPVLLSAIKRKFKLSKSEEAERPLLGRLALHAFQLSFTDTQNKPHHFEGPLPKDLQATLQQLRKWNS